MDLQQQIEIKRNLGELICLRLNAEIAKLGFSLSEISQSPHYNQASFSLIKDPYTGESNLIGFWYGERDKQRIGRLQFNSDGSFYAEYDIAKPHPAKYNFFVDKVTAWGKEEMIKAEASLLAMPEDD